MFRSLFHKVKLGSPVISNLYTTIKPPVIIDNEIYNVQNLFKTNRRWFHSTSVNFMIWEKDDKGGYECGQNEKISTIQHLRRGFNELKNEIILWKQEMIERFESDPILALAKGETDVVWVFDNAEKINSWITTSDSDHNEGFSTCSFELSKAGRGLFKGTLDTRVPKDGKIIKAGYSSVRSQPAQRSFRRDTCLDWSMYNTLVLKVRGDGRSYLINIFQKGHFDITWNDCHHYCLYTRGGPYWQISKIPFSKFVFGSKGKAQDKQCPIDLDEITHFGITCADKINGDFALEIEYIGLEHDPLHAEEFAYEMYETDSWIIGSGLTRK